MGKRSDFERVPRDFYPTPPEAVLPHMAGVVAYDEPCCGDGALILSLDGHNKECVAASDIYPPFPQIGLAERF